MLLVILLLLFAFPLPLLVPPDASSLFFWLIIWFPAGIVGLITALLVKSPRKKQAERAPRKPRRATSPLLWALFLLVLLLVFTLRQLGPAILLIANLFILMAICIIPAIIVKIRNSNQQADGATGPPRNSLSPRVWIIISPVLFLVIFMEIEFIFMPDYPNLQEAFIAWLLTGLASLIILLTLKLGSSKNTNSPPQQAQQQLQVQS